MGLAPMWYLRRRRPMADQKVKLNAPGLGLVEGTVVQITESIDRWTEIKLEDGTTLRVKPVVISAARLDGRFDPQGNPMYIVQAQSAMTVIAPDHLRQPASAKDPKVQ
jgi:hypothetical protein